MRIVNSFLSKDEIGDEDTKMIKKIFESNYDEKVEIQSFKYDDRVYYELDVDILDITYNRENIHDELMKLVRIHEGILSNMDKAIYVIIANDDTDSEIIMFEENCNSTRNIGMMISKKEIGDSEPYFKTEKCCVYLDFKYVSFDTMF